MWMDGIVKGCSTDHTEVQTVLTSEQSTLEEKLQEALKALGIQLDDTSPDPTQSSDVPDIDVDIPQHHLEC